MMERKLREKEKLKEERLVGGRNGHRVEFAGVCQRQRCWPMGLGRGRERLGESVRKSERESVIKE